MESLKDIAIKELVTANRILSEERVFFEAFGHIGARNPDNPKEFFLSRALAPVQVTEEDIYTYDLDGNCLTPTDKHSYVERFIYSEIFKARPDVMAICHNHAQEIIPFTVTDIPFKPLSTYGSPFYAGVPIFDDYDIANGMIIRTQEEAERLARKLGDKEGMFMRGHGVVVVGHSVRKCVLNSIYMKIDAQNQFNSLLIGTPKYLSDEEARICGNKSWNSELAIERAWNFWKSKVEASPLV